MRPIEELYQKYKQDLYRYLVHLTRDPSMAEDLLSLTFLKAIVSLPSFRGDSSVKTWLFGIARHAWLQHCRDDKHQPVLEDWIEDKTGHGVEERVIDRQKLAKIQALLQTKDERTRAVLLLRLKGWSFSEIAEKWHISENSARVIAFRTRQWLKDKLEQEGFC